MSLRLVFRKLRTFIYPKKVPHITHGYYGIPASVQIHDLGFLFELYLGAKTSGFFVDVGAFNGVDISNSWGLADRGWSGILIEPIPELAEECRRNHAEHPNVKVVEAAITSPDEREVKLFVAGALTTGNKDLHDEYKIVSWASGSLTNRYIRVEGKTLNSVLVEAHALPNFDLLTIDVEGYETEVFAGFDLNFWKPRMLIVELSENHPDLETLRQKHATLYREILDHKYVVVYKDAVNTVFVDRIVWEKGFRFSSETV